MGNLGSIKQLGDLGKTSLLIGCMSSVKKAVREKLELDMLLTQMFLMLGVEDVDIEEAIRYFSTLPDVMVTKEEEEEIKKEVIRTVRKVSEESANDIIKYFPYMNGAPLINMPKERGENDIQ
jgi:hypothetical protein